MNSTVSTLDTYESAYYLAHNAEVAAIECQKINGKLSCTLQITGDDISTLQYHYFKKTAEVNIHAFRKAYHQINMIIIAAKKQYKENQGGLS